MESNVQKVNIDLIIPNRFQPRLNFEEKALQELAASIKEHGIIQPIVVRRLGDKYEIIAGERRYKAATMAGLTEVPVIISNLDDKQSALVAVAENVQRKNLSSIEEALSYKKIIDKNKITQEELAKRMGVSQSAVANKLRLLNLSKKVQNALLTEKISERHARSLLQLPTHEKQDEVLDEVIAKRIPFCLPQNIYTFLEDTLNRAKKRAENINSYDELLRVVVEIYSDLDITHPFREGNG